MTKIELTCKKDPVGKISVYYKSVAPTSFLCRTRLAARVSQTAANACKGAIVKVLRSSHGDKIVFSIHI